MIDPGRVERRAYGDEAEQFGDLYVQHVVQPLACH
jgi:hypothetical protein